MNQYKVFHSPCEQLRNRIHIILVRPEQGANVGAAARAIANMGIRGSFFIVGEPTIIDSSCLKLAKHAKNKIDEIKFASSLAEILGPPDKKKLSLAATARIGSAHRPHPLRVRTALERALSKLKSDDVEDVYFVFGPEGCGLTNEEIDLCSWIVTIPSSEEYRSLNLAQSVLIFSHEMNMLLIEEWEKLQNVKPSQKEKLIQNLMQLAETSGFILPGDPFKMRPRLEDVFSGLPAHISEVKTLHGLLDQIRRSMNKGHADIRGRYLNKVKSQKNGISHVEG